MKFSRRGQSETVGVVLLTAVIVTVTVVAGTLIIADFQGDNATEPNIDIESSVDGITVTIEHQGGESYERVDDIVVILQGIDDERHRIGTFDVVGDTDNETFVPGSRWQKSVKSLSGEVRLFVVDESENEILHEATHVVERSGIVLDIDGESDQVLIEQGEKVPFDVVELFEDGTERNVTSEVTVEEIGGDVLNISNDENMLSGDSVGSTTSVHATREGDQSNTVDVTIGRSLFTVSVESTTHPVVEGETLTVTANVTNTGRFADTQSIELRDFDGTPVDSQSVELGGGETTTVDLNWGTTTGDNGTDSVTVASDDRTAATDVTVQKQAYYDLTITEVNPETLTEGDLVTVTANITNTGDVTDTQDISLLVNGTTEAVLTDLELSGGESNETTFEYVTKDGDTPEITLSVESTDSADGETVTVEEPTPGASGLIGIEEGTEPVFEGDTFEQHLTYSNPERASESVTVVVKGDGTNASEVTFELAPGDERTPTGVGFPEQGTLQSVTDDTSEPKVIVEIGE
jgi:flagellin-like protein